jgi:hypothetical protein
MKQRDPFVVLILSVITLGIYGIYWLAKVSLELRDAGAKNAPSPWWILGFVLIIPQILYYIWLHQAICELTPRKKPSPLIAILLVFVFHFALFAYWQSYINTTIGNSTPRETV